MSVVVFLVGIERVAGLSCDAKSEEVMLHAERVLIVGLLIGGLAGAAPSSVQAGPIAALSIGGNASINVQFDGSTLETDGPQTTEVAFTGILDWVADIPTASATFAMGGLTTAGPPTVLGTQVIQQFTSGTFSLIHPDSTLLISGSLSSPALTGTIGLPGDMLFTSSFSNVTGGSLAPSIDSNSLILQMHLSSINGGAGLTVGLVSPPGLDPFTAVATVDLEGVPPIIIPEPAAIAMLGWGAALVALCRRGRMAA